MKLIIMLFFIATITQAQILTGLLTDGNYRGTDITSTLGDTNTVFSDTTTYGDWELVGDSILVASNDSTLLAILHGGTVQLPLASVDGQDYRISFSAKEGETDLLDGWDFTSGWSISGGATITDNNTITTSSNGGIYTSVLDVGATYVCDIIGQTTATYFCVTENNVTNYSGNLTGSFDTQFTFIPSNELYGDRLYFRNQGAGVTDITALNIYKLDSESQTVHAQPIISYGTKSLTKTALTSDWQTYSFDFEGDTSTDTLKISLSDTAKVKIDNVVLKK